MAGGSSFETHGSGTRMSRMRPKAFPIAQGPFARTLRLRRKRDTMPRFKLDVTKALYDTDGYGHTLVQATPMQVLTLLEGFYWLWDRASGKCLIEGMTSARLSNTRPSSDDLIARRYPVAETRAFRLAQEVVQAASASSSSAVGGAASSSVPARRDTLSTRWTADAAGFLALQIPFVAPETPSTGRPRRLPAAAHGTPSSTPGPLIMALAVGLLGAVLLIPGSRVNDSQSPA